MSRFRVLWPSGHIVLPVVHVSSLGQTLRNVEISVKAGVNGVFLINHVCSSQDLFRIHGIAKERFPDLWIGLNALDLDPTWPTSHLEVEGMWADNAYIDERREDQKVAEGIRSFHKDWKGLYFGGVAFKGQRRVRPEHLAEAAKKAAPHMDVVTTSGPGTGHAVDLTKVKKMREALGDFPLAIASGITSENVREYMPHADCFLVASGISSDFENLDLGKTQLLVDTVRGGFDGR